MNKIDLYVQDVLDNILADEKMKERIKSDLTLQLNEACETEDVDVVLAGMGSPAEVAREFMDSIYENKSEIIDDLIREHRKVRQMRSGIYEYKSKATLFGLPLVHVKVNRYGGKPCVAKGILAIGTISIGIVSIGAIPIGILSIGGAAIGVISLGGLALGLLLGIGGFSAGALAIGGFAAGLGAVGGFALGEIAVGGYARGTVAIGAKVWGKYTLVTHHLDAETKQAVFSLIKTAFPGLPDWIAQLFASIEARLGSLRS